MTLRNNLKKGFVSMLSIIFVLSINTFLHGQNSPDLEQWTKDYTSDLSQPDWMERMAKYGWDSNYETHKAFRKAFTELQIEVQQVISDGTHVMAILNASANWVGSFDKSLLREAIATGERVEWKEVWSFNVIEGKFGEKWEIIQAGHNLMRSAGVNCLPQKAKMKE